MGYFRTFVSGIWGGVCIALGGVAFLSLESNILGALFFTVGLFTICTMGLSLFTGKVCYVFQRDKIYAANLPLIWLGNLAGTVILGLLVQATRSADNLVARAQSVCAAKLGDSWLSLFLLGVLCNIFIYIAVEGFSQNPHQIGKYLSLFFGVMVFILCGYEHCVADMFYFHHGRGLERRRLPAAHRHHPGQRSRRSTLPPGAAVPVRREAGIGKGGCRQSQIGPGQTTVLGFGLEWGKGADMGFPQQWEMAYAA